MRRRPASAPFHGFPRQTPGVVNLCLLPGGCKSGSRTPREPLDMPRRLPPRTGARLACGDSWRPGRVGVSECHKKVVGPPIFQAKSIGDYASFERTNPHRLSSSRSLLLTLMRCLTSRRGDTSGQRFLGEVMNQGLSTTMRRQRPPAAVSPFPGAPPVSHRLGQSGPDAPEAVVHLPSLAGASR